MKILTKKQFEDLMDDYPDGGLFLQNIHLTSIKAN